MRTIHACWSGTLHLGDVAVDAFEDLPIGIRAPLEVRSHMKAVKFIEEKDEMFSRYDEQLKWSD